MLNWRRDPGYEQRKMQHELRMKQLKSEIEQIKSETEQLRRENARLATLNAKTKTLLSSIDQHCFPDASNSTPLPPTEPGSSSS
jgi:hypothetical protein